MANYFRITAYHEQENVSAINNFFRKSSVRRVLVLNKWRRSAPPDKHTPSIKQNLIDK